MTSLALSYWSASGPSSAAASRSNHASMPCCSTRGARMQFARHLVDEQREGHPPGALSRHAPVGTDGDHAADALLTPGGHPIDVRDRLERALAQARLLHADEPLRRRAKDH